MGASTSRSRDVDARPAGRRGVLRREPASRTCVLSFQAAPTGRFRMKGGGRTVRTDLRCGRPGDLGVGGIGGAAWGRRRRRSSSRAAHTRRLRYVGGRTRRGGRCGARGWAHVHLWLPLRRMVKLEAVVVASAARVRVQPRALRDTHKCRRAVRRFVVGSHSSL
eukprot:236681-Chlamydomonas_euryale.AAC.2